ncbi:MAG: hypothetical protein FJW88_07565 [Actinobacteria bacterium]|nr:hypothetical protein [Actinomycetota bacterium]
MPDHVTIGLARPLRRRAERDSQFLTEVRGGSDVGANATRADPNGDGRYRISGEKWFCAVADFAQFLVTARVPDGPRGTRGLGCFVAPRVVRGQCLRSPPQGLSPADLGVFRAPTPACRHAGVVARGTAPRLRPHRARGPNRRGDRHERGRARRAGAHPRRPAPDPARGRRAGRQDPRRQHPVRRRRAHGNLAAHRRRGRPVRGRTRARCLLLPGRARPAHRAVRVRVPAGGGRVPRGQAPAAHPNGAGRPGSRARGASRRARDRPRLSAPSASVTRGVAPTASVTDGIGQTLGGSTATRSRPSARPIGPASASASASSSTVAAWASARSPVGASVGPSTTTSGGSTSRAARTASGAPLSSATAPNGG